jgi:hypothetical protein
MLICVPIYIYSYICVYLYIFIHIHTHTHAHTHTDIYMYIYREGHHIGKSLGALEGVLKSLSSDHNYMPYHCSNLTILLQNVLKYNNKIILIVNVNMDDDDQDLNTLNYGVRCLC